MIEAFSTLEGANSRRVNTLISSIKATNNIVYQLKIPNGDETKVTQLFTILNEEHPQTPIPQTL